MSSLGTSICPLGLRTPRRCLAYRCRTQWSHPLRRLTAVFCIPYLLTKLSRFHRLDSDGADYLKVQLEAAGIVPASQDDEDRPQSRSSERPSSRSGDRPNSRSSERSVYSNGDSATTPTSTTARGGATAFATLDLQVAYSQERRTQLMRQLQELSSPTSSTPRRPLTYQQYRESVQYVVSP